MTARYYVQRRTPSAFIICCLPEYSWRYKCAYSVFRHNQFYCKRAARIRLGVATCEYLWRNNASTQYFCLHNNEILQYLSIPSEFLLLFVHFWWCSLSLISKCLRFPSYLAVGDFGLDSVVRWQDLSANCVVSLQVMYFLACTNNLNMPHFPPVHDNPGLL